MSRKRPTEEQDFHHDEQYHHHKGSLSGIKKRVKIQDPSFSTIADSSKPDNISFGNQKPYYNHGKEREDYLEEEDDNAGFELEPFRKKKGAVNTEGFESGEDSDAKDSDSDEDAVDRRRKRDADDNEQNKDDDNEEEHDMFQQDKTPSAEAIADAKKSRSDRKSKNLLQEEKQDCQSNAAGFEEDGMKIEPFNMNAEMEEGKFDDNGHYIREQDDHRIHDTWLKDLSKTAIDKAASAHKLQEAREALTAHLSNQEPDLNERTLWILTLSMLMPRETVVDALRRLGGSKNKEPVWKKKKKEKNGNKSSSTVEDMQIDNNETANGAESGKNVEKLTSYVDKLMALGVYDIYEMSYEQIVRKLRIDEVLADEWAPGDPVPLPSNIQETNHQIWEYKWTKEDEDVHGPFEENALVQWIKSGYFSDQVVVRHVTSSTSLDAFKGFIPLNNSSLSSFVPAISST